VAAHCSSSENAAASDSCKHVFCYGKTKHGWIASFADALEAAYLAQKGACLMIVLGLFWC
jgi:hypothetical protein